MTFSQTPISFSAFSLCLMKQQQGLLALGWGTGNSKQMQFRPVTGPGTSPASKMRLYRSTLSEYPQKTFKLVSQVVLEYKLQQLTSLSITNSKVNTNFENNVFAVCEFADCVSPFRFTF